MNPQETRATFALAGIYTLRLLGLFMILPVFTPYGLTLSGATPQNIGFALGIYGLSQALLQIPFGMVSDKIGRKPVIFTGLIIFAIGSIIAAASTSIDGVALGRLIQGAGAIGSTTMALVADSTRDEHRSKAMGIIGMMIASSFFVAIFIGPLLSAHIGVNGLFWLTSGFAGFGILLLFTVPKAPAQAHYGTSSKPSQIIDILKNTQLLRLDISILLGHAILTICFMALPIILTHDSNLSHNSHWGLYLPVLIIAFTVMLPWIIISEKCRAIKQNILLAISLLTLSQLGLWLWPSSMPVIAIALLLFLASFSFLEATLPSMLSKLAPIKAKGTAMGVFSSAQFMGIFLGGILGGLFFKHNDIQDLFLLSTGLGIFWLIITLSLKQPPYLSSRIFTIHIQPNTDIQAVIKQALAIPGIAEAAIEKTEQSLYLKVDKQALDEALLASIVNQLN